MTIEKLTAGDPDTQSADIINDNLGWLRELFPEAFTEGRIDFDVLRQALGADIEDGDERYGLNWRGKRAARRLALTPSTGTLRPAPEESLEWDTTRNLVIEGDNLEALKLLAKAYAGTIKLIYIDPPYNTGKDFVYPDDFQDSIQNYLRVTGQVGDGGRITSNTETSGRFHTDWINMIYPRLLVARDLLRTDGVLFVSINDKELHNLLLILQELFGELNHVGTIVWKGATDNNPTRIAVEHEYIVCFARDTNALEAEWKASDDGGKQAMLAEYKRLREQFQDDTESIQAEFRRFVRGNSEALIGLTHYTRVDQHGVYTGSRKVHNPRPGGYAYDVPHPVTGKACIPPANGYRYPKVTMDGLIEAGRILFGDDETQIIQIKEYLDDYEGKLSSVINLDSRAAANEIERLFGERKIFDHPKPVTLLRDLFAFCLGPQDRVVDFFAGSGTTAQAVMELNSSDGGQRSFVMIQLPEPLDPSNAEQRAAAAFCKNHELPLNLAELTKERLRLAAAKIRDESPMVTGDLGFRVFKLASSNIREWDPQPEDLDTSLELSVENLKADRTEQDILYELLLKRGIELTVAIEAREISGKSVHSIGAGTMFACLSERIERADAEPVALGIVAWRDELAPAGDIRVVFRDSAFVDDVAKTNLAEILRQHGLADVKSI